MKIEKGISIPQPKHTGSLNQFARSMDIGDSVMFKNANNATPLRHALKRQGFNALGRTIPDGYRLWKIAPQTTEDLWTEAPENT
tara:strand:- start:329 stop:580 length:252 start_codon:yes stop_codon:yes gene_type:complete